MRLGNYVDVLCTLLFNAMEGFGTDEGAIARVLGGSTKELVQEIITRYDAKYSGNLVGQLNDEQTRIVQSCMTLETGSAAVEWTKLKSASPFVELGMKYSKPFGDEAR